MNGTQSVWHPTPDAADEILAVQPLLRCFLHSCSPSSVRTRCHFFLSFFACSANRRHFSFKYAVAFTRALQCCSTKLQLCKARILHARPDLITQHTYLKSPSTCDSMPQTFPMCRFRFAPWFSSGSVGAVKGHDLCCILERESISNVEGTRRLKCHCRRSVFWGENEKVA